MEILAARPMQRHLLGREDDRSGFMLLHAMLYSTGLHLAQEWGKVHAEDVPNASGERGDRLSSGKSIYNCPSRLFPALLFCPGSFTCHATAQI